MMRIIALDPGVVELHVNGGTTLIDLDVYEWASKELWHMILKDGNWYVKDSKRNYLHHRIMGNAVKGKSEVDHINRNTLDNRRVNLRFCDSSQNKFNRKKQTNNRSSRFKGVSWDKDRGKWIAQLTAYGTRYLSKRFETEEEAAKAYDEAARKYHGEFAYLNFPGET